MSGPVPSPSMNGTIGRSGTRSLPCAVLIFSPGGTCVCWYGMAFSLVTAISGVRVFCINANPLRPTAFAPALVDGAPSRSWQGGAGRGSNEEGDGRPEKAKVAGTLHVPATFSG